MDMYNKFQSPLGYQTGEGQIDSYGVDHSGFSTRDELEYQFARQDKENQLIQNYNNQGITKNYPQQGTNFWGNSDNNYGFGSSNIHNNIENRNNNPFENTVNTFGQNQTEQSYGLVNERQNQTLRRQTNNNHISNKKGFIDKFNELEYMTDIPHSISTGNKFIDKNIAKYGAKALGVLAKSPQAKFVVKAAKKAYPYIETGGANIARAVAAYRDRNKSKE